MPAFSKVAIRLRIAQAASMTVKDKKHPLPSPSLIFSLNQGYIPSASMAAIYPGSTDLWDGNR